MCTTAAHCWYWGILSCGWLQVSPASTTVDAVTGVSTIVYNFSVNATAPTGPLVYTFPFRDAAGNLIVGAAPVTNASFSIGTFWQ